jgi:hypothetical protein
MTIPRVYLGFCEVVDPWDSGQPEFLSYFCLVSTVDGELSPLAARNDPRESLFEILDVKQLRPSHYQIYN